MVCRHPRAAEDMSQRHSAEGTENLFLFSLTSPATQAGTPESPFSPPSAGCGAEGGDAEPTASSTTGLPLSSYRQGLPAPVAATALLRAAQGNHHPSKPTWAGGPTSSTPTQKPKLLLCCPVQTQAGTPQCCTSSQCWQQLPLLGKARGQHKLPAHTPPPSFSYSQKASLAALHRIACFPKPLHAGQPTISTPPVAPDTASTVEPPHSTTRP